MSAPGVDTARQLGTQRQPLTLPSTAREIHIEPATGEPGIAITVRAYVGARRLANRRNVAHLFTTTRPELGQSGIFCRGLVLPLEPKEIAAANAWLDGYFGQGQEGKAKT